MVRAEGGAAGGHGSLHARGVHGHDIRIALHHYGLVLFRDVALGQIQAEEHLGLVIEHGFRRVHVLAQLVIVEKLARTETDDIAGEVLDRPQQAPVEAVNGTPLAHLGNARGFQLLKGKAHAQQVLSGSIPALRGIAAFKFVDDFLGEATVQKELASGGGLRGF